MEAHQERVIEEKTQLDEKLRAFTLFIHGPIFAGLAEDEQSRLKSQRYFMNGYSETLEQRIAAFTHQARS
jgi:hypothetical protein